MAWRLIIVLIAGGLATCPACASPPDTAASPPRLAAPSFLVDMDYPKEALQLRQEGETRVSLQIDPKGKASDCRILQSSGSPSLDAATCAMLLPRKYRPARDPSGQAVVGEFIRAMKWTLPRR